MLHVQGEKGSHKGAELTKKGEERVKAMKHQRLPGARIKEVLNIQAAKKLSNFFDTSAPPKNVIFFGYVIHEKKRRLIRIPIARESIKVSAV